jgi:hypothetical protein
MTAPKAKASQPEPSGAGQPNWGRIGELLEQASDVVARLSEIMLREKAS